MKRIKKYAKDMAGFSFSELMIVMALVGILSAIATPSILRSMPERRLKNAARNMYADLQKARLLAVRNNRSIAVRFDAANNFYYFDDDNSSGFTSGEFRRNLKEYGEVKFGCGSVTDWNGTSILPSDSPEEFVPTFKKIGTVEIADKNGAKISEKIILLGSSNLNVCYGIGIKDTGSIRIKRQQGGGSSPWK